VKRHVRVLLSHPRVAPHVAILTNQGASLGIALVAGQAVDTAVQGKYSMIARLISITVTSPLAGSATAAIRRWLGLPDLTSGRRARRAERLTRMLVCVAGMLAGRLHTHLREAWAADLYGDPEVGAVPSAQHRVKLAAGFVAAALLCRLDDAAELAWRPVDALLSSWHGSNLAVLLPVTIAVGLILPREGLYGLITSAENLAVITTAPYLAIKGLRKYRRIATPKRPEKKASAADDPDR